MSQNLVKPVLESSAALGISATFNGSARLSDAFSKVRAFALADQAGTLNVQQSWDNGATWKVTDTVAIVASTGKTLEALVVAPLVRVQYVNGGVAQGSFTLASSLVAI